jgi:hypothetical protein
MQPQRIDNTYINKAYGAISASEIAAAIARFLMRMVGLSTAAYPMISGIA